MLLEYRGILEGFDKLESCVHPVAIVHIIFIGLWCGVIAAESVMEISSYRRSVYQEHTARMHYWIDVLIEMPIVLSVAVTGSVLVWIRWPLTGWHFIKIGCACIAIAANLLCIKWVINRYKETKHATSKKALVWYTTRIFSIAIVGGFFGIISAILGFILAIRRM